jgi:hypothetical protein
MLGTKSHRFNPTTPQNTDFQIKKLQLLTQIEEPDEKELKKTNQIEG